MSSPEAPASSTNACPSCLRRSWLLAELTGPFEFLARDRARLHELLALEDDELIEAVAGRRRLELKARHESFDAGELRLHGHVETVCRHDPLYPPRLRDAGGPRMLYVLGGARRLAKLTGPPVVLIAGSRRASDYGMETARSLARGVAAAGVTVMSAMSDGIALSAQAAAVGVDGRTIAVMAAGHWSPGPARGGVVYERVARHGCALSELPCGRPGRTWGAAAAERILARLAGLTVLVEAGSEKRELSLGRLAHELGGTLAAVPGRVTSPLSAGTNALLMEGARLVRGPEDVLELLSPLSRRPAATPEDLRHGAGLAPRLRRTLERVGMGCDTPEKLMALGVDLDEALLELSELEVMGLLGRGDGGRYVPRGASPPS